ncbi:MAG: SUMF1/EgtB/PvdO family nonheme iron enzyme [Chthoniobacterales bacterium]
MKFPKIITLFFASAVCFTSLLLAEEHPETPSEPVSGDIMVTVGDPGNKPYLRKDYELWGTPVELGKVDHTYKIGKYEVTVGDWHAFLWAVASLPDSHNKVDAYGLWNEDMLDWITPWGGSIENGEYHLNYMIKNALFSALPITHVSLYSTLFYMNWKEHGSPILEAGADIDAILKHGAYEFVELDKSLEDGAINAAIVPNEKSHFYLPSQDEWIKAAYYNANKFGGWYSLYPTQHDDNPGNNHGDVTNQANYDSRSWFSDPLSNPLKKQLTSVYFFSESHSYYGCYDMGGNVNE